MKNYIFYLSVNLLFLFCIQTTAQEFWGMTSQGGNSDLGVIFKTDANGNNQTPVYSFTTKYEGGRPGYSDLVEASNGNLYGMTANGGASNRGVLFEYNTISNTYTKKLDFDGIAKGFNPSGSLIYALNGKLYGMTGYGGASGYGVLFEYDPILNTYTKKLDFDGTIKGSNPIGSLMQATNGKLYGMTSNGGTSNQGVLFEYDPISNIYTKKLDFDGMAKGRTPWGSLMQATNGKLYGMTFRGGTSDHGVLFEYDPISNIFTKKLDFDGMAKGRNPLGGRLVQVTNGKLYGVTGYGGASDYGVLFEYDLIDDVYIKKLDFDGMSKGRYSSGSLMLASNGKLYGVTGYGGISDHGILFEYDPINNVLTKKLDFESMAKGSNPNGGLMQATNGKFYGMTQNGGITGYGVVFEYDLATNMHTKIINFNETYGNTPLGSLIQATNGKLYGMTQRGGTFHYGVLFEYDPGINLYTKKIDFNGTATGQNPIGGSLILATNGKLYGMTYRGGTSNYGVLFEYDPTTHSYTKKWDFNNSEGSNPFGSLMQASNGKLYGMTTNGGTSGFGVLFEYDPVTNSYNKKLDFDGTAKGSNPLSSLMQASNGKLYGMTQNGGTLGYGVLFEYDPSTNSYSKKIDFDGIAKGRHPNGSLIETTDGKLYGMTINGGNNNYGVLFEYDIATNSFTKKLDFDGMTKGRNPQGSLMKASNGKLYGMTGNGGTASVGVLFEYDPNTNSFTKKLDFSQAKGIYPGYSALIEIGNSPSPIAVCKNVTLQLGESGHTILDVSEIDGGSTGSGISLSASKTIFTCTNIGENIVTLTVTDLNGNSSECNAIVTIEDQVDPTVITQNLSVPVDANGNCSITADQIDNGSYDNCEIFSKTLDITNFNCSNVGSPTNVTLTVTDVNGNSASKTATVTITDNQVPIISTNGDLVVETDPGTCSATVEITANASDNCYVDAPVGVRSDGLELTAAYPVGTTTISWTTKDINNNMAIPVIQNVTVVNTPPMISLLTGPIDPKVINDPISLTVEYNDNNVVNASIKWDDSATEIQNVVNPSIGLFTVEHTYNTPGVYSVVVTLTDACGDTSENYQFDYVVIYDPNGGFVTGGGWINSPAGALTASPTLTGIANFGFVAKYKKGSTVPEGKTEFQFKAGNLNFNSATYEDMRLVISGSKANYKGTGTINGAGNYGFMISAIDGNISGGGGVDRLRIKIWDKNSSDEVIYDNNMNKDENDIPTTTLGGGSVTIHSNDNQTKLAHFTPKVPTMIFEPSMKAYPNPFTEKLFIEFSHDKDAHAKLDIYSITGARLETLFDRNITGGGVNKVEYLPRLRSSQMVLYHLIINGKTYVGKVNYNERR